MKKWKWIIGLFTLILLGGTVGLSITAARNQKPDSGEAPAPSPAPPPEVVFSAFFHFVVDLQKEAAELDGEGKKGESLRGYVQTQAGLDDEETGKLNEIAAACVEEVSQQDAKALLVIHEFQSQFPGGKVPVGVKMPPPPPELKVLQQGRDQIILAAKSKLAATLGEIGFDKVAKFAERRIAFNSQAAPPR